MNTNAPQGSCGPRRESAKQKLWRATLQEFTKSGQTVREFCRTRQLSEPSFYAWRRTWSRRDATTMAQPPAVPATPAFVPVRLSEHEGHASTREGHASTREGHASTAMVAPMEIVLAGGRCIRVRPPVDRAALVEIVAALEGLPSALESVQ
jgi:hypothetical protein